MIQDIIGQREGFGKCRVLIGQAEQVLVRNNDKRIDNFLKRLNAFFGLLHPLGTLELEGFGHNTNSQNAQLAGGLRDDRCRTGAGAAAHASGNKAHMRTRKVIHDLFDALFRCCGTDGGTRAGTQTFGDFQTHLDLGACTGLLQRLCVGIGDHELGPIEFLLDHVVDSVAARAAHTKYGDPWLQFFVPGKRKI